MLGRVLLTDNPSHVPAFAAALRDVHTRLAALQRCDRRADRGLALALNGPATRVAGHIAQVRSEQDAALMYHVHAIKGCECPDAPQAPDGRCIHWWSAFLTALAHLALAAKGYVPVPNRGLEPAVSLDDTISRLPGLAVPQPDDRAWAQTSNRERRRDADTPGTALWEHTPVYQTAWAMTVRAWEYWLDAR